MHQQARQPPLESIRDGLAQDVVRTVDVGIDQPTVTGPKQPAFHPPAQIALVMADGFKIKERTF